MEPESSADRFGRLLNRPRELVADGHRVGDADRPASGLHKKSGCVHRGARCDESSASRLRLTNARLEFLVVGIGMEN